MTEHIKSLPCSHLIQSVLGLLSTLLPAVSATCQDSQSSSGISNGSSSSRSSHSSTKEKTHSNTVAASRAAGVLRERRLAQHGPFPVNLLLLLASTLQVLDVLFLFFGYYSHAGGCSMHFSCEHSASLARTLFEGGELLVSLHAVSLFLLRCLRTRQKPHPHQAGAAEEIPSFEQVQRVACQNVCQVVSHMFPAIKAQVEMDSIRVMCLMPSKFFETLACVACEGTPSDDLDGWAVAMLFEDEYLRLLNYTQPLSKVHCRAMQVLVRRALPDAIMRNEDLESMLKVLIGQHPQLKSNNLLSSNLKLGQNWPWPAFCPTHDTANSQGSGGQDEAADAYYFPRLRDDSLRWLFDTVQACRQLRIRDVDQLCTSGPTVLTARIIAVLLSLHRVDSELADGGQGGGAAEVFGLHCVLFEVARFVTMLASQLLYSLSVHHADCSLTFFYEASSAVGCAPCAALAEGITAILLQLFRLHRTPEACGLQSMEGEQIGHIGFCYRSASKYSANKYLDGQP